MHEWNTGIMERWNIGESKFHYSKISCLQKILMPEGFQPSIIEKIQFILLVLKILLF